MNELEHGLDLLESHGLSEAADSIRSAEARLDALLGALHGLIRLGEDSGVDVLLGFFYEHWEPMRVVRLNGHVEDVEALIAGFASDVRGEGHEGSVAG